MKPLTEFHANTNGGKDGHRADCKVCHTKSVISWAKNNREKMNRYAMNYYYKKKEKIAKENGNENM